MKFTIGEIANAVHGRLIGGHEREIASGIGIDSRKISRGELFVAIKGVHFDGHDFLKDAVLNGAAAVVVQKGAQIPAGAAAIEVQDTEAALGDIAAWWRRKFRFPRVAITGSNGKSTTKEMTAAVAGHLGVVLKTEGNFNNLIGLPLTIFRMNEKQKVAILEMGMNAPGEIARLARIADPDVALITNVTAAHLEKLGSVGAVAAAKGELFENINKKATAVINMEDKWVRELAAKHSGKKITFGMQNDADVRFMHMDTTRFDSMELKFQAMKKDYSVVLPVVGAHNVMNALAAISIGLALGINPKISAERLREFHPMAMRFERVQLANGVCVINDSYNANPESMKAAFRTVEAARRAGRFVAVLGDMLELGSASGKLHSEIGEAAAQSGVSRLFVIGNFAKDVVSGAVNAGFEPSNAMACDVGADGLGPVVEKELKAGDILLVKGSRGMKMERVVEYLKDSIGMG